MLQLDWLPLIQQVDGLSLLLQYVPVDGEEELDQRFAVLLNAIAIAPEQRLLIGCEFEEIRVGLQLLNLRLLHSIWLQLAG